MELELMPEDTRINQLVAAINSRSALALTQDGNGRWDYVLVGRAKPQADFFASPEGAILDFIQTACADLLPKSDTSEDEDEDEDEDEEDSDY